MKRQSTFDNEVNSNKIVSKNTKILENNTKAENAALEGELLKNNGLTNLNLSGHIVNGSKAYFGQFPYKVIIS